MASASEQPVAESVEFRRLSELKGSLGWHPGAGLRLGLIFILCGCGTLLQLAVLRLVPRYWVRIPRFMSQGVAWLCGVRITSVGAPARGPVLFVSNHMSWIDIAVLGARLDASFVAKKEVGEWGFVATLARAYRCVFVDRERRASSGGQRTEIARRLESGDSLVLFAEGTSTDGSTVYPFKSALFGVAQTLPDLQIQPVTVSYTHINGMPISRAQRPLVAWFGDMELTSHVWQVLRLGRIRAVLQFHEPVAFRQCGSRKELAERCRQAVADGLAAANSGRLGGKAIASSGKWDGRSSRAPKAPNEKEYELA